jgi:two-component system, LytTR family, sensor kinase
MGMYIIALITPAVLWLGRRFPLERRRWPRTVALHLLFGVAFSVLDLAFVSAVYPYLGILPTILMKKFGYTP